MVCGGRREQKQCLAGCCSHSLFLTHNLYPTYSLYPTHSLYPWNCKKGEKSLEKTSTWTEDRPKRMDLGPTDSLQFLAHGRSIHSEELWVRAGGMKSQVLSEG